MSEVKANISQRRKTDYDRRLIKYMREKHRMKTQGVVKSIFIGFLAVAIILCTLPAQDADAAGGKWKKNKSGKYYVLPGGKRATGSCEIEGEYFIFDTEGRLLAPKKNSLIDVRNQTYYVSPKGTAVSGWQVIKKKLYHVKKSGAVRKNTEYKGITFTKTGAAKNCQDTKIMLQTVKTVATVTKPDMTKKQKLKACWKYLTKKKNFRYISKYPDLKKKGWQRKTAENMLKTKKGNCYSFACAFAAMANCIGYDAYVVCGRVNGSRDRARDGLTRHAWVKINGRYYDPEAQFAGWRRGIYDVKRYSVRRYKILKTVAYWK